MQLKFYKLSFLTLLFIGFSACKSAKKETPANAMELFTGSYVVESFDNNSPDGIRVTFNIDQKSKRVSGNAGCNNYSTTYTLSENKELSFGPMMMTKMYCMDSKKNEVERKFQKAMTHKFRLLTKEGRLTLQGTGDSNGSIVLVREQLSR